MINFSYELIFSSQLRLRSKCNLTFRVICKYIGYYNYKVNIGTMKYHNIVEQLLMELLKDQQFQAYYSFQGSQLGTDFYLFFTGKQKGFKDIQKSFKENNQYSLQELLEDLRNVIIGLSDFYLSTDQRKMVKPLWDLIYEFYQKVQLLYQKNKKRKKDDPIIRPWDEDEELTMLTDQDTEQIDIFEEMPNLINQAFGARGKRNVLNNFLKSLSPDLVHQRVANGQLVYLTERAVFQKCWGKYFYGERQRPQPRDSQIGVNEIASQKKATTQKAQAQLTADKNLQMIKSNQKKRQLSNERKKKSAQQSIQKVQQMGNNQQSNQPADKNDLPQEKPQQQNPSDVKNFKRQLSDKNKQAKLLTGLQARNQESEGDAKFGDPAKKHKGESIEQELQNMMQRIPRDNKSPQNMRITRRFPIKGGQALKGQANKETSTIKEKQQALPGQGLQVVLQRIKRRTYRTIASPRLGQQEIIQRVKNFIDVQEINQITKKLSQGQAAKGQEKKETQKIQHRQIRASTLTPQERVQLVRNVIQKGETYRFIRSPSQERWSRQQRQKRAKKRTKRQRKEDD